MTKNIDVCTYCDEAAADHHQFTPVKVPKACVCWESWGSLSDIKPVCPKFTNHEGEDDDVECVVCVHDKECHSG